MRGTDGALVRACWHARLAWAQSTGSRLAALGGALMQPAQWALSVQPVQARASPREPVQSSAASAASCSRCSRGPCPGPAASHESHGELL